MGQTLPLRGFFLVSSSCLLFLFALLVSVALRNLRVGRTLPVRSFFRHNLMPSAVPSFAALNI
jgi:hypothetical protein